MSSGQHEPLGISVGRVGRLAAIAGIVFLLSLLASFALWAFWLKPPIITAISPSTSQPPTEFDTLREQQNQRLQDYGWVDQSAGIARIPLSRAMELLIEGDEISNIDSPRDNAATGTTQ